MKVLAVAKKQEWPPIPIQFTRSTSAELGTSPSPGWVPACPLQSCQRVSWTWRPPGELFAVTNVGNPASWPI